MTEEKLKDSRERQRLQLLDSWINGTRAFNRMLPVSDSRCGCVDCRFYSIEPSWFGYGIATPMWTPTIKPPPKQGSLLMLIVRDVLDSGGDHLYELKNHDLFSGRFPRGATMFTCRFASSERMSGTAISTHLQNTLVAWPLNLPGVFQVKPSIFLISVDISSQWALRNLTRNHPLNESSNAAGVTRGQDEKLRLDLVRGLDKSQNSCSPAVPEMRHAADHVFTWVGWGGVGLITSCALCSHTDAAPVHVLLQFHWRVVPPNYVLRCFNSCRKISSTLHHALLYLTHLIFMLRYIMFPCT